MSDFVFNQLKKLNKYDSLANRGRRNRGAGPAPRTKRPLVGPGMWPPPGTGMSPPWIDDPGDTQGETPRPTPAIENVGTPMGYREWMGTQPYGGQISPYQPQGTDYWPEQYQDYLSGWNAKFGTGGRGSGVGTGPGMRPRKPGSGGSRDMGTPSMGNLLRGKPNKSY